MAPWTYLVPNPGTGAAIRGVNNIFWFVVVNSLDPLNAPVLQDMRPGSEFVQRLQVLQGTEAGRAYSRVGIGTSASPSGIACHGVIGGDELVGIGWKGCHKTIRVAQSIYTGVGAFMSWTGRQHAANQFYTGALRLKRTDSDWLRYVGAGGTFNGYSGSPDQTDGILPLGTQQYPGNTFQRNILWPERNISHQEANDPIEPMLNAFGEVFERHFNIARRSTSGGGGDPPPCEPVPPQLTCEAS